MEFDIDSDLIRELFRLVGGRLKRDYMAWYRSLEWSGSQVRDWLEQSCIDGVVAAMASLDKWDPERGDFFLWCYLKARTFARDRLRKAQREQEMMKRLAAEPLAIDYDPQDIGFKDTELLAAFEQLKPDQQEALALYYFCGMEVAAIARVLDCEMKTVYTIMDRGRKKARELYEERKRGRERASPSGQPPSGSPLPKPRRERRKL